MPTAAFWIAIPIVLALIGSAAPAAADCVSSCLSRSGCSLSYESGRPAGNCGVARSSCEARCANAGGGGASSGRRLYGAVAWDSVAGKRGISWDWGSQQQANADAVRRCIADDGKNCKPVLAFWESCAAVAVARSGVTGWDHGPDRAAAQRNAIAQCVKKSGGMPCHVPEDNTGCSR